MQWGGVREGRRAAYRFWGGGGGSAVLGLGTIRKRSVGDCHTQFELADRYVAVYLIRGRGTYADASGFETRLRAGDLVHRIPDLAHETVPEEGGAWFEAWFSMPRRFFDGLCMAGLPLKRGRWAVWHPGVDAELIRRIDEIGEALADAGAEGTVTAVVLMQEFLLAAWRLHRASIPRGEQDVGFAAVCERLSQDLGVPVSVPSLCAGAGIGYEAFRKRFRAQFGVGPGSYRQRLRMDWARSLLAGTDKRVGEIAEVLGYGDGYAFSKQFRRACGVAPSAYRDAQR